MVANPTPEVRMDPTHQPYGLTPPALDPYGGVHFTGDEDHAAAAPAWTGDPSSVPLPAVEPDEHTEDEATEIDRAIFAALVSA